MSGAPGTPAQDPTWYRIRYSLAAQRLHTATAGGDRVSYDRQPNDAPGEELWNLIGGLRERLQPAEKEEAVEFGFVVAEADAHGLLSDIVRVLDASGWRWVGRRPPRIVRLWRGLWSRLLHRLSSRHPTVINFRLANFLDTVVEPATVALLWSARIEQGWRPDPGTLESISARDSSAMGPAAGPLDRGDREVSEGWLEHYLEQLLASEAVRPRFWRRLLARLGVTRFRQRAPLGYRVEYNLACLLSRMVPVNEEMTEAERANLVDLVALAGMHLQRSIGATTSRRRKRVVSWAWRDPGLAGLRGVDRRFFEIMVGPLPGALE